MVSSVTTKSVFRYAVMPEIKPRMRELFLNGFHYVPFFLAIVYQIVGLLPRHHAYLNQHNMGKYGIRHVVFEAWRNISFRLKNIDQIILFFVVLAGLFIFFIQLIFLGALIFMQPVMAMPSNWAEFFTLNHGNFSPPSPPPSPRQDLAFMMLDLVFGVPHPNLANTGFFESCVSTSTICKDNYGNIQDINLAGTGVPLLQAAQYGPLSSGAYNIFPFPYHRGMHALFAVYSQGLLVIAVAIASYFIATVLAETAQTGTPFGRRFNKTWAPLRIVVAFGLLMPLTTGLNSSQYLVLYAAKYGSAFASNGWRYFNATLTTSLSDASGLISTPNVPDLGDLAEFMYVAKVCRNVYNFYTLQELQQAAPATVTVPANDRVWPYALFEHSEPTNAIRLNGLPAILLLIFGLPGNAKNVKIRFGVQNEQKYGDEHSFVSPICGEISLSMLDTRGAGQAEPGIYTIQMAYFRLILFMWYDNAPFVNIDGGLPDYPPSLPGANKRELEVANRLTEGMDFDALNQIPLNSVYVSNYMQEVHTWFKAQVAQAVLDQEGSNRIASTDPDLPTLMEKGWAGAGIWYNRVAEMNGSLISAVYSVPTINLYPAIMEKVLEVKVKYDADVDPEKRFAPTLAVVDDSSTMLEGKAAKEFANTLYTAQSEWGTGRPSKGAFTQNPFLDAIASILGLNGLYDLRDNVGTHPLAMLVGIGRSLVESSVRSLGYAAMATFLGAIGAGPVASVAASFFVSVAMLGLTVGFVLFYVVPFLPFIYFFFAVGGWIKGIFEAMVGAPLWALAHIRIDGQGLSGSAALNGYFLIFEVFLRPILIVFGLLASISIFSALVDTLNIIFPVVTENVGGYDLEAELTTPAAQSTAQYIRSAVDEFFFTVIYAIIVYLMGMSSFKLIDTIPNNILRWIGQSVATFGDQREDPAEGLVSRTAIGSQQALSKIGGGLQSLVKFGAG